MPPSGSDHDSEKKRKKRRMKRMKRKKRFTDVIITPGASILLKQPDLNNLLNLIQKQVLDERLEQLRLKGTRQF